LPARRQWSDRLGAAKQPPRPAKLISPERNFDAEVSAEAAVAASRFVADELSPITV
jgi:hypothetical protein